MGPEKKGKQQEERRKVVRTSFGRLEQEKSAQRLINTKPASSLGPMTPEVQGKGRDVGGLEKTRHGVGLPDRAEETPQVRVGKRVRRNGGTYHEGSTLSRSRGSASHKSKVRPKTKQAHQKKKERSIARFADPTRKSTKRTARRWKRNRKCGNSRGESQARKNCKKKRKN